jgi:hypothetical protein
MVLFPALFCVFFFFVLSFILHLMSRATMYFLPVFVCLFSRAASAASGTAYHMDSTGHLTIGLLYHRDYPGHFPSVFVRSI